jgi:hypothetical protein
MGGILHGSARSMPRSRAELQPSLKNSRARAASYGLNAKTVRKWRKRSKRADCPRGGW